MIITGFRRLSLVSTAAIAAVVLAACGSTSGSAGGSSAAPASLEGSAWVLATYTTAAGASQAADAGSAATLAFQPASRLVGSTGCNNFGGTWTQDGTGLTLSPNESTLKACSGALAAQETAVLAELQRVATFAIVSGSLQLSGSDGKLLLTYQAGLSGLAGTAWSATGINNGKGAVVSVPTGVEVTADFAKDGQLSGTGGCNGYNTSWKTSGTDTLELGPVAATAKACADPAGTTEAEYFAALDAVATYTIDGKTLTLRDSSGAAQVTYQLA